MVLAKLIVTILTAIGTLLLLYFNYRANKIARHSVQEMRITREEEYRPYIFLDIQFSDLEMDMVLKNDGKAAAFNIQLAVDQNIKVCNALVSDTKYHLQDLSISGKIAMLAPGDEFREWLDHSGYFFRNNEVRKISGKVVYEDAQGRKYEFPIDIDLEPFAMRSQVLRKDMPDLVKTLENLRRDLERNW